MRNPSHLQGNFLGSLPRVWLAALAATTGLQHLSRQAPLTEVLDADVTAATRVGKSGHDDAVAGVRQVGARLRARARLVRVALGERRLASSRARPHDQDDQRSRRRQRQHHLRHFRQHRDFVRGRRHLRYVRPKWKKVA